MPKGIPRSSMRSRGLAPAGRSLPVDIKRARRFWSLLHKERVEILVLLDKWPAVEPTPGAPHTNHPAEVAAGLYEQEETVSVRVLLLQRLREVDAALQRLRDGTYGRCEACGMRIPPARLAAYPTARLRVECQERLERDPALPPQRG